MKRFQSSFEKVQRIQQQQLRVAELNLQRAQSELRNADEQMNQLRRHCTSIERDYVSRLTEARQNLRPETIHAVRAYAEQCRTEIRNRAIQRETLNAASAIAMAAWRELKARCEGVEQLIQNRKQEHRRNLLLNAQTELEESARALRQQGQPGSGRGGRGAATDEGPLR